MRPVSLTAYVLGPGLGAALAIVVGSGSYRPAAALSQGVAGTGNHPPIIPGGVPWTARGPRMSFVVVSFDALRADHVGTYGYARATTPHLDAFARNAAFFENAYAVTPTPDRSLAAAWTGRYRAYRAGPGAGHPGVPPPVATVAATLNATGYATAVFTNAMDPSDAHGLLNGFSTQVIDAPAYPDRGLTAARAAAWIRARSNQPDPFLLWVHLAGPLHPEGDVPAAWRTDPGAAPTVVDQYDAGTAVADAQAESVLESADVSGLNQPVTVIVLSACGASLGEHGHTGHGTSLYEEEVHVPWIIREPGIAPGPRVAIVSLVDLAPTMLAIAGIPAPTVMEGRSLTVPLHDATVGTVATGWRRAVYMELPPSGWITRHQTAAVSPPWALLRDEVHNTWELYDLSLDPMEHRNEIDRRPVLADALRSQLLRESPVR